MRIRDVAHSSVRSLTTSATREARCRRGFTLLEVLFAVAISLLLFVAILAAVEMYRQVSVAGREDIEQSQLARTILHTMQTDVRSVNYNDLAQQEEEEGSTDEEESALPADNAATVAEQEEMLFEVDAASVYSGEAAGIFGDSNTLVVHAGRPPRRLEALLLEEPPSDLKSIAYFLAVPGADGLQGAAGSLLDVEGTGRVQGLARLQGDQLSVEFADQSGDLQLLAEQTQLLAPEVDYLQFRYFDGQVWYDAWDTTAYGRVPNAIEITLGINALPEDGVALDQTSVKNSNVYRFVVAVPTAVPYIETGTTTTTQSIN